MQIRKKGLLFQLAYGVSDDEHRIKTISLCRLFWRLPVGAFCWAIALIIVGLVLAISFLFARRPSPQESELVFIPFERWPLRLGRRRVWPFWPLLLGAAMFWLLPVLEAPARDALAWAEKFNLGELFVWLYFWVLTLVTFLLVILGIFWVVPSAIRQGLRESEAWRLFSAWLKARKEGLCPILEVVDD